MIVIVEVWVPTLDINQAVGAALSHALNDQKPVADKKVTTMNAYGVAETKVFFGIDVRRFDDAWTVGYAAFQAAWKSASNLNPRIIRIAFHQTSVEWSKPQEVTDGSQP